MVRSSYLALGALVFPRNSVAQDADAEAQNFGAKSSCDGFSDCGSCSSKTILGAHTCSWCEIDLGCHDLGSVASPCATSMENNHCVSKATLSSCDKSECTVGDAEVPRHLHLAVAGPTGMRVAWKTNGPASCSVVVESSGLKVPSETRTQYLVGHGYHHVATLTALTPGSDYGYHVDCEGQTSQTRTFHVPATDLSEASFLFVGDQGTQEAGQGTKTRTRLEALKASTDMTVHVGDIGYADDSFIHPVLFPDCVASFCYEAVFDRYMDWMESHIDDKPFMVTPGNHESECHSPNCIANRGHADALRNFSAYNTRFAMPSKESNGVMNMWYSFDYGPVHFVAANTETDFDGAVEGKFGDGGWEVGLKAGSFGQDGEYLRWLEADLIAASANRADRPWIVAYGHRPWFTRDHRSKDPEATAPLRALYEKYGVDLYLAGHVHAYSSHLPPAGSSEVPVVVTGAAGCDEGLEGWAKAEGVADDGYKYYTDGQMYQVGTLDATRESLTWKAHSSETGDVFDTFTLTKQVAV